MGTEGSGVPHRIPPTLQTDAALSQANPTSGTNYEALATTKNVRVLSISASVTWTVQPTPLVITVTVDGVSYIFTQADPVSTTNYICWIPPYTAPANGWCIASTGVAYQDMVRDFLLDGKSVKVEAKITGGTVQNLSCRVKYAKW